MASTSSAPEPRLDQEHRLVAEALVGVGDERRGLAGAGAAPGSRRRRRAHADEVQERALEQPVEALPARVDDAGLAQDRQQGRRPRRTFSRRVDGRREDRLDVVVALGRGDCRRRRLADDGQDRALDRLRDGAIGGPRAFGRAQWARSRPLNLRLAGQSLRPCRGGSGS